MSRWAADATPIVAGRRLRAEERARSPEIYQLTFDDVKIKTKKTGAEAIVPFVANDVQRSYLDVLMPDWEGGELKLRGMREIILKARQFGLSTLIAVLYFIDTLSTPGTGTVIASYDLDSSEKLFEMIDRMYRHLPESSRPRTQRANTRELYWPGIDCHYQVLTAGSKAMGRSWTINNLHVSEYAFWEHPDVIGGLLQAVPADGNIFIESTANGEGSVTNEHGEDIITGSAYHVYYERAKARHSEYTDRFFAWFHHPEYRAKPRDNFDRTTQEDDPQWCKENDYEAPTSERRRLYERYGNETRISALYSVDDWQLSWRRKKIEEPGMGPGKFAQEYPANDVEAFRTSGKKFFAGVFDVDTHVRDVEIQPWWTPVGGFDWGFGVPYAGGLGWIFPMEAGKHGLYVSDESYGARIKNTAQAAALLAILKRRALEPQDLTWFADPAMWAKEGTHQSDNVGRSNVEDFWDANLQFVKANNNREHGCANMREYMSAPGALIISPSCYNLVRTLPLVLHDPHDIEVYEKSETAEQHAVDMLRYMLNSRPYAPDSPVRGPVTLFKGLPITPIKQLPPELQSDEQEEYPY